MIICLLIQRTGLIAVQMLKCHFKILLFSAWGNKGMFILHDIDPVDLKFE